MIDCFNDSNPVLAHFNWKLDAYDLGLYKIDLSQIVENPKARKIDQGQISYLKKIFEDPSNIEREHKQNHMTLMVVNSPDFTFKEGEDLPIQSTIDLVEGVQLRVLDERVKLAILCGNHRYHAMIIYKDDKGNYYWIGRVYKPSKLINMYIDISQIFNLYFNRYSRSYSRLLHFV